MHTTNTREKFLSVISEQGVAVDEKIVDVIEGNVTHPDLPAAMLLGIYRAGQLLRKNPNEPLASTSNRIELTDDQRDDTALRILSNLISDSVSPSQETDYRELLPIGKSPACSMGEFMLLQALGIGEEQTIGKNVQLITNEAEPYLLRFGNEGTAFTFAPIRINGVLIETGSWVTVGLEGYRSMHAVDSYLVPASSIEFIGLMRASAYQFRPEERLSIFKPPTDKINATQHEAFYEASVEELTSAAKNLSDSLPAAA